MMFHRRMAAVQWHWVILIGAVVVAASDPLLASDLRFRVRTIDGKSHLAQRLDWNGRPDAPIRLIDGEPVTDATKQPGDAEVNTGSRSLQPAEILDIATLPDDATRATPRAAIHPEQNPVWVYLDQQDILHGSLVAEVDADAADTGRTLRLNVPGLGLITMPLDRIAAIRFPSPGGPADEAVEFDRTRSAARLAADLLVVRTPTGRTTLTGALEQLDTKGWRFVVAGRSLTGSLDRLSGIVFARPDREAGSPPASNALRLATRGGDVIKATPLTLGADSMEAEILGHRISIAWAEVARIEFQSDRVIFLRSLQPTEIHSMGFWGESWPVRASEEAPGGSAAAKPVGSANDASRTMKIHSGTRATYAVPEGSERLEGSVRLGANPGVTPSIIRVRILEGERELFAESLTFGNLPKAIGLEVRGLAKVTIEVETEKGPGIGTFALCTNVRFIR